MDKTGGIKLDDERQERLGFDEAILCEQKTPEQISQIIDLSQAENNRRFFTRFAKEKFEALPARKQALLMYDALSSTAILGSHHELTQTVRTAIVSAGSSDAPVVAEAHKTLQYYGENALLVNDVGVAGIWRLMERIEDLHSIPVIIAVAGMDAALPSVLGGLLPASIICVPTSTGYGASRNGETALSAMLASCAPGLTVVNIDNGYGAACAALRIHNIRIAK